ncbi:hypothetical protein OWR29_45990 [Actinoplanes sp. Pm04-4]|uniref:Uncharacterized protein n=1 Tax=Paractinoplanes pyxinae TaxID=2997416 RepID=A0ABT4BFS7_9ACTN|nr:hypothetical protein [Actinoplanes pyxinae]MCY1145400.1 hypothetical protein [Actinoplanes pyxinae]
MTYPDHNPGPSMWAGPAAPGPAAYPYVTVAEPVPAPAASPSRWTKPQLWVPAVLAGAALVFSSGWFGGVSYANNTPATVGNTGVVNAVTNVVNGKSGDIALLQQAQDTCDSTRSGTEIADGGYTLTVDSRGEDDYTGLGYYDLDCVWTALQMPEAVKAHIGQTRALDGRQEDSWGSFTASWTYHPDAGVSMVVRVV